MNEKQQELIKKLGDLFVLLGEECDRDAKFHEVLIANKDLFPETLEEKGSRLYSFQELGHAWYNVVNGERK